MMNINGSGHTLAIIRGGKYNNHVVGVDKEEKKGKYLVSVLILKFIF